MSLQRKKDGAVSQRHLSGVEQFALPGREARAHAVAERLARPAPFCNRTDHGLPPVRRNGLTLKRWSVKISSDAIPVRRWRILSGGSPFEGGQGIVARLDGGRRRDAPRLVRPRVRT